MKLTKLHPSLFLMTIILFYMCCACAPDPSSNVPKAEVKPANTSKKTLVSSKSEMSSSIQNLALTGEIIFIGSKITGSHTNRFKTWTGNVKLGTTIDESTFNFTVQTNSVEADYLDPKPWSGKLKKHLLSPDFFDVKTHPTATFVSTSLKAMKADQYQVTGILTIRGQSKEISFPAKISQARGFSASAEFSINRKEYQIMYNGKADDLIRDGVVLKINLQAKM